MVMDYRKEDNGVVVLTIQMDNKPVNVLGGPFVAAWGEAVARLEEETDLRGVILTSSKQDFMAGADIDELYALRDPAQAFANGKVFRQTARRFESLGKPVVAAINGTALGGGFEVALTAHYRVALNHPKLRIGFPEVTLGLFPGGGGTQRLPRLIGIQPALEILLEGRVLKAQAALKAGLVHELADDPDALMAAAHAWIDANPEASQPWDAKKFRWPGGNPQSPAMAQVWAIAPSMMGKKARGNYPNQANCVSAVYEGSLVDFDTADRIENRFFANTVTSQVSKNMLNAFWYQLNHIKKGGGRPADIPPVKVKKVGILGAGMMGSGIAYSAAFSGVDVVLKDVSLEQAEKGKAYSENLLAKRVGRGRMDDAKAQAILGRIQPTDSVDALSDCDLIIEAVFEDRALKAKVTQETEAVIAETSTFASNTSTLPITGLAKASGRPERFIGLHFFSPVDKMKLVEIIVGKETSDETLACAYDFVLQINKVPIVVNDSRGFYTSRAFATYVDEGMAMVAEGIHPRAVESAGVQAGMPVGPLAVGDEVSLSLMHHIATQTRKDMEAEGLTYTPRKSADVVVKMVESLGRVGKKAGKGFYDYPTDGKKRLWPGLAEHYPLAEKQLDQTTLIERLMFRQALEAARCMEEGVLRHVADANLGSIFGWGFAPFKGGALQYITDYGLPEFVARARELAESCGERFAPPKLLSDMAEKGETF